MKSVKVYNQSFYKKPFLVGHKKDRIIGMLPQKLSVNLISTRLSTTLGLAKPSLIPISTHTTHRQRDVVRRDHLVDVLPHK